MFEVDVKNVTEEEGRGGEGRRGPARVWGSDTVYLNNYHLKGRILGHYAPKFSTCTGGQKVLNFNSK